MEPGENAATLILQMDDVARQVCMTAGKDHVMNIDAPQQLPAIMRERFAPDAIDSLYREVVLFLHFKRTDQPVDMYLLVPRIMQ